jgi:hypothetical protein
MWQFEDDRSVTKNKAQKIPKYKDLTTKSQRVWNVKIKMVPEVKGVRGTISKSLRQYPCNRALHTYLGSANVKYKRI